MAKQGQPMKVPGKGHGSTGDRHAPAFPPIKAPPPHKSGLPAKKRQ